MAMVERARELEVYKRAFAAAMRVFELTKQFPSEEKFILANQMRRSSRSVCSNLTEAWRKRGYKAVFVNKLSDSMQEGGETQTWLEFALACHYISQDEFEALDEEYEIIVGKLNSMEMKADSFCF